jgi:hypothetical protein
LRTNTALLHDPELSLMGREFQERRKTHGKL